VASAPVPAAALRKVRRGIMGRSSEGVYQGSTCRRESRGEEEVSTAEGGARAKAGGSNGTNQTNGRGIAQMAMEARAAMY